MRGPVEGVCYARLGADGMDRKKKISAILMGAAGIGLLATFVASRRTTPEDQVRKRIDEMVARIEAKDAAGFVSCLTPEFILDPDGIDRDQFRLMLAGAIFAARGDAIAVAIRDLRIRVDRDRATVKLRAGVGRGAIAAGFRPDHAWEVTAEFLELHGDWMLSRAETLNTEW